MSKYPGWSYHIWHVLNVKAVTLRVVEEEEVNKL